MGIIDDVRQSTANQLQDEINKLKHHLDRNDTESLPFINSIQSTLDRLDKSGFQPMQDDRYSLRGIHDAFQHLLAECIKNNSVASIVLKPKLIEINIACANYAFNNYIDTSYTHKNKTTELIDAVLNKLKDSLIKKYANDPDLSRSLQGLRSAFGSAAMAIENNKPIDLISLQRAISDVYDDLSEHKGLGVLLNAVNAFNTNITEIQAGASPVIKPAINRLMMHPDTIDIVLRRLHPEAFETPSIPEKKLSASKNRLDNITTSRDALFTTTSSSPSLDNPKSKPPKNKNKGKEKASNISAEDPQNYQTYKIAVFGNNGCGKTSFISRVGFDAFSEKPIPLHDSDYKVDTVIKGRNVRILDTNPDDRYNARMSFSGADAVIIMFDMTDRKSFDDINSWLQHAQRYASENAPIVLVGTKSDLKNRAVATAEARDLADQFNLSYAEVSAKNNINLNKPFDDLMRILKDQEMSYNHRPGAKW